MILSAYPAMLHRQAEVDAACTSAVRRALLISIVIRLVQFAPKTGRVIALTFHPPDLRKLYTCQLLRRPDCWRETDEDPKKKSDADRPPATRRLAACSELPDRLPPHSQDRGNHAQLDPLP